MEYIYTDKPIEMSAQKVADNIRQNLGKNHKVLLLLTGGSGLQIATKIDNLIKDLNLSNLFISLTDERYGKQGHRDENWQQLLDAGIIFNGANLYRPLQDNCSLAQTSEKFSDWLKEKFEKCDHKIGLFGIGSDGHTAGIKPCCAIINSTKAADYFIGEDYQRFSITFPFIKKLDLAVVQASGQDKKKPLKELFESDIELALQPAQILKQINQTVIFTNIKKEEL